MIKQHLILIALCFPLISLAEFIPTLSDVKVGFTYTFGDSDNNRKTGMNLATSMAMSTATIMVKQGLKKHDLMDEFKFSHYVTPVIVTSAALLFANNENWIQRIAYLIGAAGPLWFDFCPPPRYSLPADGSPPPPVPPSPAEVQQNNN